MEPLILGNVVTAGFILYRSHSKIYFLQALIVSLWSLLPYCMITPTVILLFNNFLVGNNYTWAWLIVIVLGLALYFYAIGKSLVNASIISRLAFVELINQPETVAVARSQIQPKIGSFLQAALLLFVILFGIFICLTILLIIPLLNLILFIPVGATFFWFIARFFLTDVILAVEENNSAIDAVSRSWELTKGKGWQIVLILVVTFLVTLPLQIIMHLINRVIVSISIQALGQNGVYISNNALQIGIVYLIILAIVLLANAIILPLWQAIKSVIYYDRRTRREGLGLKLRERNI